MNNNFTEITFYCFQPVEIENEVLLDVITKNYNVRKIRNSYERENNKPDWYIDFSTYNDLYTNIIILDLPKDIKSQVLKNELNNIFVGESEVALSEFLDLEKTNYYLTLDLRYMYFILVYEITFQIEEEHLLSILKSRHDNNIYSTIRDLLVKETNGSVISQWAKAIRYQSIIFAKYIINKSFKLKIEETDLLYSNNSGNITCLIPKNNLSSTAKKTIGDKFIEVNKYAERVKNNNKPIVLNDEGYFYFNGRFHTIFINDSAEASRYIPIQFHMQYMWYLLKRINVILEMTNEELIYKESLSDIKETHDKIESLINKVEVLVLHNENFKFSIESDNKNIYSKIQDSWNIEGLLKNTTEYIIYFKQYLDRIHKKVTERINSRQNKILFFISILQVITLISVWGDFLTITSEHGASVSYAKEIINIFGKVEVLRLFNFYLVPVILLAIIILSLVYIFSDRWK